MAISFESTKFQGRSPEFWRGEAKVLPGGFKPIQSFVVGTVISRGTPVYVDFEAHSAAVVKAAEVLEGSTTKNVRLAKGSLFQVGDSVTKLGGDATTTVESIDASNDGYDVIVLKTGISGLANGNSIVEAGDTAGKAKYEFPNAVVAADLEIKKGGIATLDVAYDAVVLYPSLPNKPLAAWLNGFCLKANPNILYIKQ